MEGFSLQQTLILILSFVATAAISMVIGGSIALNFATKAVNIVHNSPLLARQSEFLFNSVPFRGQINAGATAMRDVFGLIGDLSDGDPNTPPLPTQPAQSPPNTNAPHVQTPASDAWAVRPNPPKASVPPTPTKT